MVRRVDQCIRSSPWIVLGERSAHHLFGGGGEGAALGPFPVSWNVFHLSGFSLSCFPPFCQFPASLTLSGSHAKVVTTRTALRCFVCYLLFICDCIACPGSDGCCSCACHGQEGVGGGRGTEGTASMHAVTVRPRLLRRPRQKMLTQKRQCKKRHRTMLPSRGLHSKYWGKGGVGERPTRPLVRCQPLGVSYGSPTRPAIAPFFVTGRPEPTRDCP